jgi:hypothetical protein
MTCAVSTNRHDASPVHDMQGMAKRPVHRRSCCRGTSKTGRSRAISPANIGRRRSAAMSKGSNDRGSGERGSARLERRASWRERDDGNAVEMLDRPRQERHRQLRRLRQKRSRAQMDCGADRTVIVCITKRVLRRRRSARQRSRGGDSRSVLDVAEMDVSERQGDLNRQREQRDSCASPQLRPDPPHH